MMQQNIPENTDTERLQALSRHNISTDTGSFFSVLTQRIECVSLARFADYIIAVEGFRVAYGYKRTVLAPSNLEVILTKRLYVWLRDTRKATPEEEKLWNSEESQLLAAMNNMFERKPL